MWLSMYNSWLCGRLKALVWRAYLSFLVPPPSFCLLYLLLSLSHCFTLLSSLSYPSSSCSPSLSSLLSPLSLSLSLMPLSLTVLPLYLFLPLSLHSFLLPLSCLSNTYSFPSLSSLSPSPSCTYTSPSFTLSIPSLSLSRVYSFPLFLSFSLFHLVHALFTLLRR